MICPKCENEMEYEEIKWPAGIYRCDECEAEYDGERFACDSDGVTVTDHVERLYK